MLNKLFGIFTGWILYLIFDLGFLKDETLINQIKHRSTKCDLCPLKKRNWCSRKNKVNIAEYKKNDKGIYRTIFRTVNGCGCYLKAKYFTPLVLTKCPMNKWEI